MIKKIVVEEYNPKWAFAFDELREVLLRHLKSVDIEIEHVGSTSVVGLAAKPVIDIDIIIKQSSDKESVIMELRSLGYNHVGNLGITGREAFKRPNDHIPDDGSRKKWSIHNLYLCTEGSIGLNNHLNFRDYLRLHPDVVVAYGRLKRELAQKHPNDIDAYIDGKTNFIINILGITGMNESDTSLIDAENRIN